MPQNVFMQDCADRVRRADFGCLFKSVVNKTGNYTIPDLGQNRSGTCYTNRGASGSITYTLPTPATGSAGRYFYFEVAIAQNIVLQAAGGLKINNGSANGTLTLASSAPGIVKVTFDGTGWYTSDVASVTSAAWGSVTGTLADQTDLKAVTDALTATDALKTPLTTITIAEVAVSNSELKNLRATPKTLVAAPAAGKVLRFLGATLSKSTATNAITESTDNMAIKYTNGSGAAVSETIEATGFIDQTTAQVIQAVPVKDALLTSAAALVLHNTGDGEYGGNAANDCTLKVFVHYATITL